MDGATPADFAAFVAAASPRLLGAARLLDPSHADDLVQDTLVRVAERWERLDDVAPHAYARTVPYIPITGRRWIGCAVSRRTCSPTSRTTRGVGRPHRARRSGPSRS